MSEQEDFHWPEKLLEKMQEIDNKARLSKEAEMKKKLNRNQKHITPCHGVMCFYTTKLSNILAWTYVWYISRSPTSLQLFNHLTPRIHDIFPSLS